MQTGRTKIEYLKKNKIKINVSQQFLWPLTHGTFNYRIISNSRYLVSMCLTHVWYTVQSHLGNT